jgi:hypothetical protein
MKTEELVMKAKEGFARLTNTPAPTNGIVGVNRIDGGWMILLEAVLRKAIPDTMDILGIYEIRLDNEGTILSLERKGMRKRGETIVS